MVNVRAHVFVSGIVQGVFFRQNTKRKADNARVVGWVRNLPDGQVEAVFEGDQQNVDQLVEFCRRGPPAARVETIRVHYDNYTGEFSSFEAV